jgi:hypothetical protein
MGSISSMTVAQAITSVREGSLWFSVIRIYLCCQPLR